MGKFKQKAIEERDMCQPCDECGALTSPADLYGYGDDLLCTGCLARKELEAYEKERK